MLHVGAVLQGRYRIEQQIGQGGMGAVFLAKQVRLADRPVALKELILTTTDADERRRFIHQFERECRILATLSHPGLVDVKDFFEEGGALVLVMEYVEGRNLSDVIFTPATLEEVPLILKWAGQLLEVVEYLHHHSPPIVLRDLKPDNIMLEPSGRIRVIDFGIAREQLGDTQTSTTTVQGAGSPGYAPPEQYAGRSDERADIYSLGATLYALLSARVPPISVLRMTDDVELVPLNQVNPNVCQEISDCMDYLMAVRREERPQTIDEVRTLLAKAIAAQAVFASPSEPIVEADPQSLYVASPTRATPGPLRAASTRPLPGQALPLLPPPMPPTTVPFAFADDALVEALPVPQGLSRSQPAPAPAVVVPSVPPGRLMMLGAILVVALLLGALAVHAFWHPQ